jgi:hypothetical protein
MGMSMSWGALGIHFRGRFGCFLKERATRDDEPPPITRRTKMTAQLAITSSSLSIQLLSSWFFYFEKGSHDQAQRDHCR